MKKIAVFMAVLFLSVSLFAQKPRKHQVPKLTKKDVAVFINKTNSILKESAEQVKKNEVYTGALIYAKDYQKKAISDFKDGKIKVALTNSAISRDFCKYAYQKNTGNTPPRDWEPGPKYRPAITVRFTKEKIEKELEKLDDKSKEKDELDIDIDDVDDGNATDDNSKGKNQK